ncbi:sensor histidine kinase [Aquimarina sp. BL5]|uniref:ATP-binding protein n=1 Tax=Aquimarina sp. BL5 TaxID=1714860 RepID=UPI000E481811|nr:HAMP domain-containing sensor histidine kinase [Aquimarina sp. BL5]AXT52598.1 sensor histidine kinase [Aquimarina sp. BL5]RKN11662.1 sensor histidine kinase [Aquimarina sp. BL5]
MTLFVTQNLKEKDFTIPSVHLDKEKGEIYINDEESYINCSVRDNGKGIPEKYRERIFQLFESIDSKKECIGIGLPIVKKIVDYDKGDIRLESEVGVGTTFFINLQKE